MPAKKGAKRDALLATSGLTEDDLSDQDNRIPEAAYRTMIGAAIAQTGDTALLLRHTFESRLETISVVGQIVHTSASFRHSIEQLNRYLHLMASGKLPSGTNRFEILNQAGGLWIVDHRTRRSWHMSKSSRLTLRGPLGIAFLGAVPALPGAFVLAGILQGSDAEGILHDMVQPHYFTSPEPIVIHIASGILFSCLAPFQFFARLRMRYRKLHRIAGRIAITAGLLFALTAVWLMGRPPAAPELWLHYTAMNVGGFGTGLSFCLSFLAIRRGDINSHRQWMRRAIAFGLLGASRIIFDLILIPVFGYETPTSEGLSVWFAIALNLFVAERLSRSGANRA